MNYLQQLVILISLFLCYAQAQEGQLKRDLLNADSPEAAQEVLKHSHWEELSQERKTTLLANLCLNTQPKLAIEAILNTGLTLDFIPSDEPEDFILSWLFFNKSLSTEEMLDLAQSLIQAGAKMGSETLLAACAERDVKRIAFCLDHGADVNSSDAGYPPLTAICLYSRNQLIKELEDDATEEEHQEATRKQQELDKQHIECVRYLLDHGADVNGTGENRAAPLNFASLGGSIEVVQLLLDYGADVNHAPMDGISPLHDACGAINNDSVIKLLIQHGAKINQRSKLGLTPLMYACLTKRQDIVLYLLRLGADASAWSYSSVEPSNPFIEESSSLYIPPLPTLAFCLLPSPYGEKNVSVKREIFVIIFEKQSFWAQCAYILSALTLIALPFLALWLLI